jgi:hypothetical protein
VKLHLSSRWVDNIKINLAEDRDKWRALVNAVMNLLDPYNAEKLKWLHDWWPLAVLSYTVSCLVKLGLLL